MGKRNENSDLKKVKLETGTVYQTPKGGNYYFRYQINGARKCVSLKTRKLDEAVRKAKELHHIFLLTVLSAIPETLARYRAQGTPENIITATLDLSNKSGKREPVKARQYIVIRGFSILNCRDCPGRTI